MVTHRTKPQKVEQVTAFRVLDLSQTIGLPPQSWVVRHQNGTTDILTEAEFEERYVEIPTGLQFRPNVSAFNNQLYSVGQPTLATQYGEPPHNETGVYYSDFTAGPQPGPQSVTLAAPQEVPLNLDEIETISIKDINKLTVPGFYGDPTTEPEDE